MDEYERFWIHQYKQKGALWIHNGNPKRPHALLTSGNHSNGFFNSRLVIPDEKLLQYAAFDLLKMLEQQYDDLSDIDIIVGPQTGATKLAEFLSTKIGGGCRSASPAKSEKDGVKSMLFTDEELSLIQGRYVLLCEDVITTGGSIGLTVDAVLSAGGIILPYILCLVNRSKLEYVEGMEIVALINQDMPIWTPDECPLCKEGSEAIRPKGPEEWARLNEVY